MTRRAVALTTAIALALVAGGLATWHQLDRPGMIGALCEAGLPNLSRPSRVGADALGCAALARKEALSGSLVGLREATLFLPDDELARRAWFVPTDGLADAGLTRLSSAFDQAASATCGFRVLRVETSGWMTLEKRRGVDQALHEFHADELISVRPATDDEIAERFPADLAQFFKRRSCDE